MSGVKLTSDASHDWFTPPFLRLECCRRCGIVRRADRQNATCKGVVHIALREDAALEKTEGGR